MEFWLFDILALLAIAIVGFLLVLILFEPGLRYRISPPRISIDSPEFLRLLGELCDAEVCACDPVEVLADGPNFYAAEIAAISKASKTIHLESYIFKRGRVAQEFIEAHQRAVTKWGPREARRGCHRKPVHSGCIFQAVARCRWQRRVVSTTAMENVQTLE